MSAQTLRFTLTEGIMRQQGSAVPREQFQQLHRLSRGCRHRRRRLGRGHDVQARPARGRSEPAGRDVDGRHRSAQQPALERTTVGTHEQGSRQSRARVGDRVSENRGAAHVRSDHRLDDVLRAGADRQSARARHAQCMREVGLRRRRDRCARRFRTASSAAAARWRSSSATLAATSTRSMRRPARRSGKPKRATMHSAASPARRCSSAIASSCRSPLPASAAAPIRSTNAAKVTAPSSRSMRAQARSCGLRTRWRMRSTPAKSAPRA